MEWLSFFRSKISLFFLIFCTISDLCVNAQLSLNVSPIFSKPWRKNAEIPKIFWTKQFPRKILPALSPTEKTFPQPHATERMILLQEIVFQFITHKTMFEFSTQNIIFHPDLFYHEAKCKKVENSFLLTRNLLARSAGCSYFRLTHFPR